MLRLFRFLYLHIFTYKNRYYPLLDTCKELKVENARLRDEVYQLNSSLNRLVEPFKSEDLVVAKIVSDKNGNQIVITVTEGFRGFLDFINVKAFDVSIKGRQEIAKLFAQKHRGYLHITDIQSTRENAGIGTILLKTLFQFIDYRNRIAKHTQVNIDMFENPCMIESVSGDLSNTDYAHFDKLIYFYTKHGFEISMNDSEKQGSIKRKVKVDY